MAKITTAVLPFVIVTLSLLVSYTHTIKLVVDQHLQIGLCAGALIGLWLTASIKRKWEEAKGIGIQVGVFVERLFIACFL